MTAWCTLRELDARLQAPRGTAFRAFKRLLPQLREHHDYRVLDHAADAETIEPLRRSGRIYAGSVQVVLLTPAAAEQVTAAAKR